MTSGGATKNSVPGKVVPDGGWGWMIVLASFMIHFIMDGITYSMGDVFLQPMKDELQMDRARISGIYSLLPAITLGIGPLATIFTNRYGCRAVTIVGSIIAALGFLISSIFANLYLYYASIGVVGGIGFGLIYLPAIVSVGNYFEARRSFAMGIAVSGSGLGTLAFPWIMEFIIGAPLWFDYSGGLLLESATIFVCILFGIIMIPLAHEQSEIRRLERKARLLAKQRLVDQGQLDNEQNDRLLSSDDKKMQLELEQIKEKNRQRSAVVPREDDDQLSANEDSPDVEQNQSDQNSTSLLRKDAVYQGSLHNIPLFNEDPDEYRHRVAQTDETSSAKGKGKSSFLVELAKQIDLNLLKDVTFALFAVSNFLTSLGFNIPYIFAKDLAIDAKVNSDYQTTIIMSIGIANCFGRLIIGYLGDRPQVNRLLLYNTTLIVAGLSIMAAPFSNSWVLTHITYASLFGFFSGGYVGLTSIIVVDLIGVDKLCDAFGTLLLFQGIAVAAGAPLAGFMRDMLSHLERPYLWPYLIFGGSVLISGLMLFAIPPIKRYQERKRPVNKDRQEMGVLSYSRENLSEQAKQQNA